MDAPDTLDVLDAPDAPDAPVAPDDPADLDASDAPDPLDPPDAPYASDEFASKSNYFDYQWIFSYTLKPKNCDVTSLLRWYLKKIWVLLSHLG